MQIFIFFLKAIDKFFCKSFPQAIKNSVLQKLVKSRFSTVSTRFSTGDLKIFSQKKFFFVKNMCLEIMHKNDYFLIFFA